MDSLIQSVGRNVDQANVFMKEWGGMVTHIQLITRIAIGAALGGVIGYERDRHGRQVGLRTHLIVAMTSATFMVISNHFYFYQGYESNGHSVEADVSRIAASVVSGIGFLAGGAILRTGATIQGLTTAAGLWLVTAIGLCSGGGMYPESIAVTIMGLVALTTLRRFKDKNDRIIKRHVTLQLASEKTALTNVILAMNQIEATISAFDYKNQVDNQRVTLSFEAQFPESTGVHAFIAHLERQDGLREIHVSQNGHY